MTSPPPRPRPPRRHPGGFDEQPTQRMRPVSDQQPYGERRPSAQQPPYGRHSGGVRHRARSRLRRPSDQTAVITGIIAVAALLVAGLGAWVISKDGDEDTRQATPPQASAPARTSGAVAGPAIDARVGDCIKVNSAGTTDADVETIDCAEEAAVYKVGIRDDREDGGCPGENYVKYTERDNLLLCLTLNARQGECFHESEEQDSRVSCDSPDASYEVGEIHEGAEDAARCGERDAPNALTYPRPPLTICRLTIG